MQEIAVVVGISKRAGTFDKYEAQLQQAGIPLHIEPHDLELSNNNLGDLNLRISFMRRLLLKVRDYRRLILTDGWDMLFYGTREELIAKTPDGVLLSAERVCWPEPELAPRFPDTGTEWRYVNGGGMAGTHKALTAWTEALAAYAPEHGEFVDQRLLNRLRMENAPLAQIDSTTKLFYTMTRESGQLEVRNGRPYNRFTGEYPNFIHHCAKLSPDKFLKMMGDA
jgi:hypothetical protein